MIPTLDRYLYQLNKDRDWLKLREEKRKALFLTLGIFTCITISTLLWLIYR